MADWALIIGGAAAIGVLTMSYTLDRIAKRLDRVERAVQAVYEYALEIDPSHDDERALLDELFAGDGMFAGMHHRDLVNAKRARGERTLRDPILQDDQRL